MKREDTKALYESALQQVKKAWNEGRFNTAFRLKLKEDGITPEYSFDDKRWRDRPRSIPNMTLEVDSDGNLTALVYIPSACGCCPPDECYMDISLDE